MFVNLASSGVYSSYDPENHDTNRTWSTTEPIYIGMDFNVNMMSAIVFVKDYINDIAVFSAIDLFENLRDTPDVVEAILQKYSGPKGLHPYQITIHPDASGNNTSSKAASESDITILKRGGFKIQSNKRNPYIKDRVISCNAGFSAGRLKVNKRMCEPLSTALQQQVYDSSGKPAKSTANNIDDLCDAFGYAVYQHMSVVRQSARTVNTVGF